MQISTKKQETLLGETGARWDEVKSVQAQVKATIQPVMEDKGAEKHAEVQAMEVQVMNYQMNFRNKAFFDAASGFSAAYEHLDAAALEIATYKAEAVR